MIFLKKSQKKITTDQDQVNLTNLINQIFKNLTKTIIIAIKIALETVEITLIIHREENHNVYEKNNFLFFIINKF
tara:strand:+ start:107 stop:331 length:225 start_codon:yes stop_codon:yes gene_type:complete